MTSSEQAMNSVTVQIEPGYEGFVPELFKQSPVEYFESVGRNIKPGHTTSPLHEDPSAVKELPVWTDGSGKELHVIAKRIKMVFGGGSDSGPNPFHEFEVMKLVSSIDLPAPKPIAKAEQNGIRLFVMEKINGINWYDRNNLPLKEKGYSDEEIFALYRQAEEIMEALKKECDAAGITRSWKLKDMIFDIDFDQRRIRGMVPTDWEQTEVNQMKLEAYRNSLRAKH